VDVLHGFDLLETLDTLISDYIIIPSTTPSVAPSITPFIPSPTIDESDEVLSKPPLTLSGSDAATIADVEGTFSNPIEIDSCEKSKAPRIKLHYKRPKIILRIRGSQRPGRSSQPRRRRSGHI
jgi:hypothetical protein